MENNRISAIIPVFNVDLYLEQCLSSVVNQTIPFYQIILINDGSTDDSLRICKKYADKYENIIFFNQENRGLATTRNRGIKYANSEWIIFVDSDDLIENNFVEIVSRELVNNTYDVLFYNARIYNETKEREYSEKTYIRGNQMYNRDFTGMEFFTDTCKDRIIVSACCAIYSRSFLLQNKIVFPEGYYFEDNLFFVKIATNAKKIRCIPNQLYIRRYREGSITVSRVTKKKCEDLIQIHTLIVKYLLKREYNKHEFKIVKQFIFSNYLYVVKYISYYREDAEVVKLLYYYGKLIEVTLFENNDENSFDWNDIICLSIIHRNNEVIISSKEVNEKLQRCVERIVREKLTILKLFDQTKRIGVYGIGKHTEALLMLSKQYIGDINCDLFYITTSAETNSFGGKPLYSVNNIPPKFDYIIISSMVYQKEMYDNLLSVKIKKEKIISMYLKEEKYDISCLVDSI